VYKLHIDIIKYLEIKSIWQFCPLDFPEERKQLLEMVGPELQSIYDDMGIEVSKRILFIVIEPTDSPTNMACTGAAGGHAVWC